MTTRRTHVVRIYDDSSGTKDKGHFVDIEVLDAIAFRVENDREVILKLPAKSADPVIRDDLGLGVAKSTTTGTRLSHMEKVASKDGKSFFAAEVLDCMAFRDISGAEWILDMPSKDASPFNVTSGAGDDRSTRRTHNEKLSPIAGEKNPTNFITSERCDTVSFRSLNGQELIIKMPSSDDGSDNGRADTVIDPVGYDATDNGATPPENSDPNVYFKFMKGSAGVFTGDGDTAAMGPLWWLRRVSGGEILVLQYDISRVNVPSAGLDGVGGGASNSGPKFSMTSNFGFSASNIEGDLTTDDPGIKTMPKSSSGGIPPIKMNDDTIWWTAQPNTSGKTDFTVLLFLNVAKLRKDNGLTSLKINIDSPKLLKPDSAPLQGTGYYVWTFGSDFTNVYIPVHPAPDATNAFGPYPFDDFGTPSSLPNYISLADYQRPGTSVSSLDDLDTFTRGVFAHIGFHPTDFPSSNGALGFKTAGGASAWASARTAGVQATNDGKSIDYGAISIDFGDSSHPPPNTPQVTVATTVRDYTGKSVFNYDAANQPLFGDPTDPARILSKIIGHTAPFDGSTITVTLAANGTLSIDEGPPAPAALV